MQRLYPLMKQKTSKLTEITSLLIIKTVKLYFFSRTVTLKFFKNNADVL